MNLTITLNIKDVNPLIFDNCSACVFCNDKRCKLLDVDIADPNNGRLFICPIVSISIDRESFIFDDDLDIERVNRMDELISKREALASIKALYPNMMPVIDYFGARRKWFEKNKPYFECENAIMSLQPAKPETVTEFADRCRECGKMRTGHWIIMGGRYIKCSECGHVTKTESPDIYNFCMVCGTKMSENPTYPESEDKNGWV